MKFLKLISIASILRFLASTLLVVLCLVWLLLDYNDTTPLKDSDHYRITKRRVNEMPQTLTEEGAFKAGWCKLSITPGFDVPSLGHKRSGLVDKVLDSLYVRTMVFSNEEVRYAIISYDLMIVHPIIRKKIEFQLIDSLDLVDAIYFSATHTHNGYGGWAPGLVGSITLGGFDSNVFDLIIEQTTTGVKKAIQNESQASMSFFKHNRDWLVVNRTEDGGAEDPWLRNMIVSNESGRAILSTYAAHPTCLARDLLSISGDYPGEFTRYLESSEDIQFAMFCAGAVGSQGPGVKSFGVDVIQDYVKALTRGLINDAVTSEMDSSIVLNFARLDLQLREPHLRIGSSMRLRKWVFSGLMGPQEATLTCLRIGDVTLVGTPCDFSGELVHGIQAKCPNTNVMVTSFNGDYIGYVTADKHYHKDTHEVRQMGWYGPNNGQFFSEMMTLLVNKMVD